MEKNIKYAEIFHYIVTLIYQKKLQKGDRLPSSSEICKQFSVSENIVKTVWKKLAQYGFIQTDKRRRPEIIFDIKSEGAKKSLLYMLSVIRDELYEFYDAGYLFFPQILAEGLKGLGPQARQALKERAETFSKKHSLKDLAEAANTFLLEMLSEINNQAVMNLCSGVMTYLFFPLLLDDTEDNSTPALLQSVCEDILNEDPEDYSFVRIEQLYDILVSASRRIIESQMKLHADRQDSTVFPGGSSPYSDLSYIQTAFDILYEIAGEHEPLPEPMAAAAFFQTDAKTIQKAYRLLQTYGIMTERLQISYSPEKLLASPAQKAAIQKYLDALEWTVITSGRLLQEATDIISTEDIDTLVINLKDQWENQPSRQWSAVFTILDRMLPWVDNACMLNIYEKMKHHFSGGLMLYLLKMPEEALLEEIYTPCTAALTALENGAYEDFTAIVKNTLQWILDKSKKEFELLG